MDRLHLPHQQLSPLHGSPAAALGGEGQPYGTTGVVGGHILPDGTPTPPMGGPPPLPSQHAPPRQQQQQPQQQPQHLHPRSMAQDHFAGDGTLPPEGMPPMGGISEPLAAQLQYDSLHQQLMQQQQQQQQRMLPRQSIPSQPLPSQPMTMSPNIQTSFSSQPRYSFIRSPGFVDKWAGSSGDAVQAYLAAAAPPALPSSQHLVGPSQSPGPLAAMPGSPVYSMGPTPLSRHSLSPDSFGPSNGHGGTHDTLQNGRDSMPSPRTRLGPNSGIIPGASSNFTPIKNEAGKYDCPHCVKNYLHAKHLKRHMLRHSGDRPYQCALCHETFTRSDILKRHFSKCQIRKGNPHGKTHLSLTHETQRRRKEEKEKAAAAAAAATVDGDSPASPEGKRGTGKSCDECVRVKVKCNLGDPCDKCQLKGVECTYYRNSRSSLGSDGSDRLQSTGSFGLRSGSPGLENDFHMPPPTHPHAHMTERGQLTYQRLISQAVGLQTFPGYGTSLMGGWPTEYLPPNTNDTTEMSLYGLSTFMGAPPTQLQAAQLPTAIDNQIDRLEAKCSHLREVWRNTAIFLQQAQEEKLGGRLGARNAITSEILALEDLWDASHVRRYTRMFFTNFCCHFPFIHVPTIDLVNVYDGLLMAMTCMGAVYCSSLEIDQHRQYMNIAFEATHRMLSQSEHRNSPCLEQIQASLLFHILFTWHGNEAQRIRARSNYKQVVDMARRARLPVVMTAKDTAPEQCSWLHQVSMHGEPSWNWETWVRQEQRNRTMYTVYLLDTAFVLWFNQDPLILLDEIDLTLPADDAIWEAKDSSTCAELLGVGGSATPSAGSDRSSQPHNLSGSGNLIQPTFRAAVDSLVQPTLAFTSATNALSKFILIHAIHVYIHQRNGAIDAEINGGRAGNVVGSLMLACEKWKVCWDRDTEVQYPDGVARVGFCRDGLPFYYLARVFLSQSRANYGIRLNDDGNVRIVAGLLHNINQAIRNGAMVDTVGHNYSARSKEGASSKIDPDYGVEDLTYDMKLLFQPISTTPESDD